MSFLRVECPCCGGYPDSSGWMEPPEHCGYCRDVGEVSRYKAWEWKVIDSGGLPPSMWFGYLLGLIVYKPCPEQHPEHHLGCKSCRGSELVKRFGKNQ